MPIEFSCRHCSSILRTPDDSAGKAARCPKCGKLAEVPGQDGASTQPTEMAPGAQPGMQEPNPNAGYPVGEVTPNPYSHAQRPAIASPENSQIARNRLLAPVITLLVVNILMILMLLLGVLGGVQSILEDGVEEEDVVVMIGASIWTLLGITGVIACVCMLRMRGYVLSIVGVICSMIAGAFCCFIPSIFATWTLVVLLDGDVKRAFK